MPDDTEDVHLSAVIVALRGMETASRDDAVRLEQLSRKLSTAEVKELLTGAINGIAALSGLMAAVIERGALGG